MKENINQVTGSHVVCGVIGDPISHTLSPLIHNEISKAMGIKSIYVPFHVLTNSLEEAIKGAYALGIKGLNVTMPHKQELFKYITALDESAKMIGAINTLIYEDGGYCGYNTDYTGLYRSLKEQGIEWKGKNVAIIGSGGAAYAAYAAAAKEAGGIYLFNRTPKKAEQLKEHMNAYFDVPAFVYEYPEDCPESFDLVIQTTGVGMGELAGEIPKGTAYLLKEATAAVDLIYHPKETAFLNLAKGKGCKCLNGFGMLFYQAAEAFGLMHHISCDGAEILNIKRELSKNVEV